MWGPDVLDERVWEDRLMPGEKVVWWGQPRQGLMFTGGDLPVLAFGAIWMFTVFEILGNAVFVGSAVETLVGLFFFGIGFYVCIGRYFQDAWARRHIIYAVTDKRVLILRTRPAPEFKSMDIARIRDMEISERNDGWGTIQFGPGMNQPDGNDLPSMADKAQFIWIAEAREVFSLIQRQSQEARGGWGIREGWV